MLETALSRKVPYTPLAIPVRIKMLITIHEFKFNYTNILEILYFLVGIVFTCTPTTSVAKQYVNRITRFEPQPSLFLVSVILRCVHFWQIDLWNSFSINAWKETWKKIEFGLILRYYIKYLKLWWGLFERKHLLPPEPAAVCRTKLSRTLPYLPFSIPVHLK